MADWGDWDYYVRTHSEGVLKRLNAIKGIHYSLTLEKQGFGYTAAFSTEVEGFDTVRCSYRFHLRREEGVEAVNHMVNFMDIKINKIQIYMEGDRPYRS